MDKGRFDHDSRKDERSPRGFADLVSFWKLDPKLAVMSVYCQCLSRAGHET